MHQGKKDDQKSVIVFFPFIVLMGMVLLHWLHPLEGLSIRIMSRHSLALLHFIQIKADLWSLASCLACVHRAGKYLLVL